MYYRISSLFSPIMNVPPKINKLTLPSGPDQILRIGVQLLDKYWRRTQYTIGGGTVLAARWNHRHSTDIDCFMDEPTFRSIYRSSSNHMEETLNELEKTGQLKVKELELNLLVLEFPSLGELSLVADNPLTQNPKSREYEINTGIKLESTAEILAKKLAYRVAGGLWKQRDFFDLVVAHQRDPNAFSTAMDVLADGEKKAIAKTIGENLGNHTLELGNVREPYNQRIADMIWELSIDLFEGRPLKIPPFQELT